MNKILAYILLMGLTLSLPAQIYVATDGSNSNPGTREQPYGTISKAIAVAIPGDTIYIRGGLYMLLSTVYISNSRSGNESDPYYLWSYPGEKPVLDFSGQSMGSKGISLRASYWHIRGLDVKGAGDNGLEIDGGSNNIIETCSFYENRDSGVQLSKGASNNRIINCDAYYNADPPGYENADGFAPKLTVGSNNYFYGCRAWQNCDDGWDGYLRDTTDVTTILENCWTWRNGYLKDGTDPGAGANGNGFKMGGGDNSNSERLMHHFILTYCLAFENKGKGFDQNNNTGSMTLLHCTAYMNLDANYRITKPLNTDQTLTVKNSVSLEGAYDLGAFAVQENNSWLAPFHVSEDDFLSIDPVSAYEPRQSGGNLPVIPFMHLSQGSDLIDGGADLGLPFYGEAPDLGVFESDYFTFVQTEKWILPDFILNSNTPNPFNPVTMISFFIANRASVNLEVYDVHGCLVERIIHSRMSPGFHSKFFDGSHLSSGIYIGRLEVEGRSQIIKMELIK